ncbi:MAG TPA: cupin domain-containing protein [Longimicrobiales bacterium]|nr:cupin domain-containing protein [Longimicrobiales bacterium]
MPSIQRDLSGDCLVFDLEAERERAADPEILERSGRNARTLLKSGSLRVTLIVLAAGGEIAEHHAEGPITVRPLDGQIQFTIGGTTHDVGPGQMLAAGPGVPHSVASEEGASFLLTVSHSGTRGDD